MDDNVELRVGWTGTSFDGELPMMPVHKRDEKTSGRRWGEEAVLTAAFLATISTLIGSCDSKVTFAKGTIEGDCAEMCEVSDCWGEGQACIDLCVAPFHDRCGAEWHETIQCKSAEQVQCGSPLDPAEDLESKAVPCWKQSAAYIMCRLECTATCVASDGSCECIVECASGSKTSQSCVAVDPLLECECFDDGEFIKDAKWVPTDDACEIYNVPCPMFGGGKHYDDE